MSNLTDALSQVSREVERLREAGVDAGLLTADVSPHTDEHGQLHAVLEFKSGDLYGITFTDSEPWNQERREALVLAFATVCGISLAFAEADLAG